MSSATESASPGGARVSDAELAALRAGVERRLPVFLDDLATLVNTDCGSYTPAGVDRIGRWTGAFLERLGAEVSHEPDPEGRLGATVIGTLRGDDGPRLLMLAHLDTVFEVGTAAARPFRIADGRAHGPGVTDMKAGLLAGLHALRALHELAGSAGLPFERVTFLANPDEEIGSTSSSPHIQRLAAESDACLVLECARANGDIVSARKGVAELRVQVEGKAAHSGVEPEQGRSAILEAAHQVVALAALNGRWPGVTLNVGVLRGGTRPNIVPETASYEVDLRAPARADLEAAEAELREIVGRPTIPETRTAVELLSRHWPMEKGPGAARLAGHAVGLARRLGFELADAATGGASDGNTTAGLGVPTLDGLGPVGGLDHSPGEYLEIDSIVPRTALLAALILAIGRDPAFAAAREGRGAR